MRLVQLITRPIMCLADEFKLGLNVAQVRQTRFQQVDRRQSFGLNSQLISFGFGTLQKPELMLLQA